jgi:hypothetical protein
MSDLDQPPATARDSATKPVLAHPIDARWIPPLHRRPPATEGQTSFPRPGSPPPPPPRRPPRGTALDTGIAYIVDNWDNGHPRASGSRLLKIAAVTAGVIMGLLVIGVGATAAVGHFGAGDSIGSAPASTNLDTTPQATPTIPPPTSLTPRVTIPITNS